MLDPALFATTSRRPGTVFSPGAPAWSRPSAALAALDQSRRQILPRVETLKFERNQASEAIAKAKRAGEDATALLEASRGKGDEIKSLDAELEGIDAKRKDILLRVPNLPHASVPVGKSAEDNVVVRTHGTPPVLDFTPKPHWDLGAALGILDFERAARMSGARFSVLLGPGAPPRPRADPVHARHAHARARLHRGAAAVPGHRARR